MTKIALFCVLKWLINRILAGFSQSRAIYFVFRYDYDMNS